MENLIGIKQLNKVAIYCRLSKDDGTSNESISIQNQKDVLTEYVLNKGWVIYDTYVDDGYSGTNFERPDFKRMIQDIERGHINVVITKDLSRLGRNYLQAGYYTEQFFPLKKVRYIALNDNFDTNVEDGNEIVPFKNLINEWYARDISKKIRFTVSNKMKNGDFTKSVVPLYGYVTTNNSREINEETAEVVRYIFEQYCNGVIAAHIAKELTSKKIYTPSYYNYITYGYNALKMNKMKEEEKYHWTKTMITKILEKEDYTGTYIRGKRQTKFKVKGTKPVEKEKWNCFYNRFPSIITKEMYEFVQNLRHQKKAIKPIEDNLCFRGLLYCGYCGKKLRLNKRKENLNQETGTYRVSCRVPHEGGNATINNKELEFILSKEIGSIKRFILDNKKDFLKLAREFNNSKKRSIKPNLDESKITALKKRQNELDNYIRLAFESYAKNELPRKIYESMIKNYKEELDTINVQINEISKDFCAQNKISKRNYEADANILVSYLQNASEEELLTYEFVHLLISKIYIKSTGKKEKNRYTRKKVIIIYNNIDELIKEFIKNESIR